VTDTIARNFRIFAERIGNDLKALAALRGGFWKIEREQLAAVTLPVLIVVGENDVIARDVERLVEAMPTARLLKIPGKDHLTVVPDQRFKDAVAGFLTEAGAPTPA
jgi:pimeloyl-ACP methyl ester carboxylesterase